jgi:hypothetical protein
MNEEQTRWLRCPEALRPMGFEEEAGIKRLLQQQSARRIKPK